MPATSSCARRAVAAAMRVRSLRASWTARAKAIVLIPRARRKSASSWTPRAGALGQAKTMSAQKRDKMKDAGSAAIRGHGCRADCGARGARHEDPACRGGVPLMRARIGCCARVFCRPRVLALKPRARAHSGAKQTVSLAGRLRCRAQEWARPAHCSLARPERAQPTKVPCLRDARRISRARSRRRRAARASLEVFEDVLDDELRQAMERLPDGSYLKGNAPWRGGRAGRGPARLASASLFCLDGVRIWPP